MADGQEDIAGLAVLAIVALVGITIFQILLGGTDASDTLLVRLANHPNLFLTLILILLVIGAVLSITQSQR